MIEQTLQDRLDTLGVLRIEGTDQQKTLRRQQRLRAAFFLDKINDMHTFLHGGIRQSIPNFNFCESALKDPDLLTQYAEMLDDFSFAGVDRELQGSIDPASQENISQKYRSFFTQRVFTNNYATYHANFLRNYPAVVRALDAIKENFQKNIREACTRINKDLAHIQSTFADTGYSIDALKKIQSTGSDFHKGGKQVLILTFNEKKLNQIVYQDPLTGNWISDPIDQDVKVVYKPGDIELDCLIAGNSEAVNKVHYTFGRYQIFQQKSLFEIFNDFVDQSNDADLVRLPTYKILPMVYGSKLAAGNGGKVNIRSSYGYIEFLKHHFKRGHGLQYADGASDYKIFPNDRNKTDIITKFYKQIGHFVALASIISITDIHSENLIVSNYQPHVIDLELSLTRVMDNIDKTGLFGNYGAVTAEKSVTTEIKLQDNSLLYLKREGDQKFYAQNRLWTVEPHAVVSYKNQKLERQHVPLEAIHIGIVKAFGLLHKNNNYTDNKFTAWFNRLTKDSGVIVRYMPYPTSRFETTVASVYRLSQFLDDAQYYKQVIKEDLAEVWKQDRRNEIPNPNYLVFQAAYMENDLLNCDIPVYYHRIGSLDILDSSGQVVVVTTTIKIRQRKEDRTGFEEVDKNTNLGRGTFFAQSPMAQIVRQNQFSNVFNDNGRFNTRMNLVLNQVSRQLRMQALNQQSINALIT